MVILIRTFFQPNSAPLVAPTYPLYAPLCPYYFVLYRNVHYFFANLCVLCAFVVKFVLTTKTQRARRKCKAGIHFHAVLNINKGIRAHCVWRTVATKGAGYSGPCNETLWALTNEIGRLLHAYRSPLLSPKP